MIRYIKSTDVAKMLRAALKQAFPGVRFSVRTDSSIHVDYIDGPPIAAVELIAKRYAGSYFDGMTDYQGSIFHTFDGERVSLLSTFVFVHRELSGAALLQALDVARAAGALNVEGLDVELYTNWKNQPAARVKVELWHSGLVGAANSSSPMHPVAALATWFDRDRPTSQLQAVSTKEADRLQVVGDDSSAGAVAARNAA